MTEAPKVPQVPWLQPTTSAQYVRYMTVLGTIMVLCIAGAVWFSTRVNPIPPVIQKSRNLMEERRYDEAVALLLPVIQGIEKSRGPEDTTLVKHFDLLAEIYTATNREAEAGELWKRSFDIRRKNLGPDHPESIGSGDRWAMSLLKQKKFAEAEPLLRKSLAHREGYFGPEDPGIMPSLNRMAELYLAQGKIDEAEPFARRSVAIGRLKVGLQPPSFGEAQHFYGRVLAAQGKADEAVPLYANALAAAARLLPEAAHIPPKPGQISHGDFADLCKEAAAVYRKAGKEKDAKELEAKAELILHPKQ
jgi:tetratricopeptide (TPR) repeat protein